MKQNQIRAEYDVVVIGGGAAGLSGAVALSRSRRSVLVIDSGSPRNAPAAAVHNYLAREGTSPLDLLAAGRAEVAGYGGQVVTGTVTSAEDEAGAENKAGRLGFRVGLVDGRSVRARRLLVATGLVDELPAVPGLAERWGRDVLHCPYCHGWEVRDQVIGVLASGPMALHQAQMFRQLSDDVTLFLNGRPDLGGEELEQVQARGIKVVSGEVSDVEVSDDRVRGLRLASGEVVPVQAVVVAPRFSARADVLLGLGLPTSDLMMGDHVAGSYVAGDPMGATGVPGVWVAGNVAALQAQVISSAAAGLTAGAAINADLITEDTRLAVEAARAGKQRIEA